MIANITAAGGVIVLVGIFIWNKRGRKVHRVRR